MQKINAMMIKDIKQLKGENNRLNKILDSNRFQMNGLKNDQKDIEIQYYQNQLQQNKVYIQQLIDEIQVLRETHAQQMDIQFQKLFNENKLLKERLEEERREKMKQEEDNYVIKLEKDIKKEKAKDLKWEMMEMKKQEREFVKEREAMNEKVKMME